MTSCRNTHGWLARLADEPSALLSAEERASAEQHLASCAECRAMLADQRFVARVLQSRPPLVPSPAFSSRLAARLDDVSGWLGLLDWQMWTYRLAPVAVGTDARGLPVDVRTDIVDSGDGEDAGQQLGLRVGCDIRDDRNVDARHAGRVGRHSGVARRCLAGGAARDDVE